MCEWRRNGCATAGHTAPLCVEGLGIARMRARSTASECGEGPCRLATLQRLADVCADGCFAVRDEHCLNMLPSPPRLQGSHCVPAPTLTVPARVCMRLGPHHPLLRNVQVLVSFQSSELINPTA